MLRSRLVATACALLLVGVSDASAGFLRRRAPERIQTSVPCASCSSNGVDPTSTDVTDEAIKDLLRKLTKEEQKQFEEMADAEWFTHLATESGSITADTKDDEALRLVRREMHTYLAGTPDARKQFHESFKKETAPLSADESKQFLEMVAANKLKTTDFLEFASQRVSERAKIYKEFKDKGGNAPEVTAEELSQFIDTVKANKDAKKPAFNDEKTFYPIWQAMTPAQRKAIYEARGK